VYRVNGDINKKKLRKEKKKLFNEVSFTFLKIKKKGVWIILLNITQKVIERFGKELFITNKLDLIW
jgi:hypothetical protein